MANKADKKNDVSVPTAEYDAMATVRHLPETLMGGTPAMRAAGTVYLPKEPKEDEDKYKARKDRTVLFNGYSNTVGDLSNRPFCKAVTVRGAIPKRLESVVWDVNGENQNITQFAREELLQGIHSGIVHILVDYPDVANLGKLSKSQEAELDLRPHLVMIKAQNLIGWRYERLTNGKYDLTQIRILENVTESDGLYGSKIVERVRVINKDSWELHKKDGDGKWVKDDEGTLSLGKIPLVTIYLNKTGFMTARPVLEDLAWANLEHWQSTSDQKNILRFLRMAILVLKGIEEEELEKKFAVGPNFAIRTMNTEADVAYAEHTGKGVEAGQTDLDHIEEHMEVLGMAPLVRQPGNTTATGEAIHEGSYICDLQAMVRAVEKGILESFQIAAEWLKVSLPSDFAIDIYSDFAIAAHSAADFLNLLKARQAKEISRETFLTEIRRRGVISETVDVEEEIARIADEAPDLDDFVVDDGEED